MILTFPGPPQPADASPAAEPLARRLWVDVLDPTPEDCLMVEKAFGLRVPTRTQLEEIEISSRLRIDGDTLYMSAPLIAQSAEGTMSTAATGFVLAPNVCLTVRYARIGAFEGARDRFAQRPPAASVEVFTALLEEVVDRAADRMERAAQEISEAAQVIYADPPRGGRKLSRETERLRRAMLEVGRASDRLSLVRYVFVSVDRMAAFVADRCPHMTPDIHARLDGVRKDIASLDEFETSLTSRVQLLHDAASGFIAIEQNEVVKMLTIVSVVGVPPVLVAGIYGMNFKIMPELGWSLGYPYALLLIVLSTLAPLAWFKFRGWL
jgi:magnesium transporter